MLCAFTRKLKEKRKVEDNNMFCSNCGIQIPDGANVCPGCGTPVASYAAEAKASAHNSSPDLKNQATEFIGGSINSAANSVKKRDFKSLLKNKLVIAAAALIVVIVVLIIVIANVAGSSSAPFAVAENQINQFYTEDYTTVLFYNGKQIKTELDGKYVNVYSNNAKTSVYVTNNDMLYAQAIHENRFIFRQPFYQFGKLNYGLPINLYLANR